MVVAGFDWDDGNWPKCGKHGLKKEEVEAIFSGTITTFPAPDRVPGETRFIAIGTNESGRALLVVFTLRRPDGVELIRPISARYMHEKELRHHERESHAQKTSGADDGR